MKCPICDTENRDDAVECSCGYNLEIEGNKIKSILEAESQKEPLIWHDKIAKITSEKIYTSQKAIPIIDITNLNIGKKRDVSFIIIGAILLLLIPYLLKIIGIPIGIDPLIHAFLSTVSIIAGIFMTVHFFFGDQYVNISYKDGDINLKINNKKKREAFYASINEVISRPKENLK